MPDTIYRDRNGQPLAVGDWVRTPRGLERILRLSCFDGVDTWCRTNTFRRAPQGLWFNFGGYYGCLTSDYPLKSVERVGRPVTPEVSVPHDPPA